MSAPDPHADLDEENREFATIDFKPFDPEQIAAMVKDFSDPTYSQMMNDMGARLRLALLMLGDTKSGLIELSRNFLEDPDRSEELFTMMSMLSDAADRFKSLHEITQNAFFRLNCAACVVITTKH